MANSIVTFKIMPESPEVDMEAVKAKAFDIMAAEGAKGNMDGKIEPIAFGLKQALVMGMFDSEVNFEGVADKMAELEGVNSAEVYRIDLAMG